MANPVPDCLTCGACCHGEPSWVRLVRDDEERLGPDAFDRFTALVEQGRGYFVRGMRMDGGRCAALARRDDGTCACTVYATRPQVCRDLQAGSGECLAARARVLRNRGQ